MATKGVAIPTNQRTLPYASEQLREGDVQRARRRPAATVSIYFREAMLLSNILRRPAAAFCCIVEQTSTTNGSRCTFPSAS